MYLNKFMNPSKCTLSEFDENFANLGTKKLESTHVDNKSINDTIQTL